MQSFLNFLSQWQIIIILIGCIYFETVSNDFCPPKSNDGKYFFCSCLKHWDQGLIIIIVYYCIILYTKKEQNIIISRVISSHMGPIYTETPYF